MLKNRWPRNHNSSWNITEWDEPNNNLGEPLFRAGTIHYISCMTSYANVKMHSNSF